MTIIVVYKQKYMILKLCASLQQIIKTNCLMFDLHDATILLIRSCMSIKSAIVIYKKKLLSNSNFYASKQILVMHYNSNVNWYIPWILKKTNFFFIHSVNLMTFNGIRSCETTLSISHGNQKLINAKYSCMISDRDLPIVSQFTI